MKHSKQDVTEARERLLTLLKPGDTVYTVLRHVSRSGMQRRISLYAIVDGQPAGLDWAAAAVIGANLHRDRDGIVVGGCGMDMGFHLVYNLGCALWPKGDGVTATGRNGSTKPEYDGGYLLNHRWM